MCTPEKDRNEGKVIMGKKDGYKPVPVDTEGIELPDELHRLAEMIAENVHEVWAANRMKEGWIYGEQRDDDKKTHPCLVPYSQLPESEKDYDRATSRETLKLILRLGFQIHKLPWP